MNKIVVNFTPCTPAPSRGYDVKYRVLGSGTYIDAGNFFVSPAIFYDHLNPAGTCYEGFVRTDCGTSFGNPVHWQTFCGSGSGDPGGGDVTCISVAILAPMISTGSSSVVTTGTFPKVHTLTLRVRGTASDENIARVSQSQCWPGCVLTGGGVFDASDNPLRTINLTYGLTGYIAIVGTDTIAPGEHIVALFDENDCGFV